MENTNTEILKRKEKFMGERFYFIMQDYAKLSRRSRINYFFYKSITAMGAVFIPVVNNLPLNFPFRGNTFDLSKLLITIFGLIVAISVALEDVFKNREKYIHYSTTYEYLKKEVSFYQNFVGEYSGLDEDAALKQFVKHVESAVSEGVTKVIKAATQEEAKRTK